MDTDAPGSTLDAAFIGVVAGDIIRSTIELAVALIRCASLV